MLKSIRGNLKGNLQAQRVGAGVGDRGPRSPLGVWNSTIVFMIGHISCMLSKIHLCCFVDSFFSVPLTFDLTGRGNCYFDSVCQRRLQGCNLAFGKELKEKWRGAHDQKERTIPMRCHNVYVHLGIVKTKNVFGLFMNKQTSTYM